MDPISRILTRRQVFGFRQLRQHSQALECRVAEGGKYAAKPQFNGQLRYILAKWQVFGFWQLRQNSQALELRVAQGGNYAARSQ
jgi:hypothetical protein